MGCKPIEAIHMGSAIELFRILIRIYVCGYGSYRSVNSVVKSINLNPKYPFHGVSLNQLIMSFFARHAFHISVPDPYRFEYLRICIRGSVPDPDPAPDLFFSGG
jgi:hypothetical protein